MQIDHLPDDVFGQIFEFLPLTQVVRLRRVSKRFNDISRDVSFWITRWKAELATMPPEPYDADSLPRDLISFLNWGMADLELVAKKSNAHGSGAVRPFIVNEHRLLSVGKDSFIRLWHIPPPGEHELTEVTCVRAFEGKDIYTLASNHTRRHLAICGDSGYVGLLDLDDDGMPTLLPGVRSHHASTAMALTFASEHVLVSGGWDKTLNIFNTSSHTLEDPLSSLSGHTPMYDTCTLYYNTGSPLVACVGQASRQVELLDVATYKQLGTYELKRDDDGGYEGGFPACWADGDEVIAGDTSAVLHLFDARDRSSLPQQTLTPDQKGGWTLQIRTQGPLVFSECGNGRFYVFDRRNRHQLADIAVTSGYGIRGFDMDDHGRVAFCSWDECVRLTRRVIRADRTETSDDIRRLILPPGM